MQAINVGIESKKAVLARDASIALFLSVLIGLCSKIAIPLFFTPVPLTIQPALILLFSALIGSKRGFSMVACLLAQVAMGLPVLSSGAIGLASFVGPTGGYLFGYLAAGYVTGFLMETAPEKTARRAFGAMAVGNLIMYVLGAGFLSLTIGLKSALLLGVAPFVLGDLCKLILSVKALQWLGRV